VLWLVEVELEMLIGFELELLVDIELEIELLAGFELELLETLDAVVDVAVALTDAQGVVGDAFAQAQRELAAPRTLPAETPQAASTQFKAADWIADD
jgi:hypothetical protein